MPGFGIRYQASSQLKSIEALT